MGTWLIDKTKKCYSSFKRIQNHVAITSVVIVWLCERYSMEQLFPLSRHIMVNVASWRLLRWAVVALVGVFLFCTLKPSQPWDGDAELYIQNALNILHQQPYGLSNYVVNAANTIHPAAYPPGLPLLMAPVLSVFGISYLAIKVLILSCFIVMLIVLMQFTKHVLKDVWVVVLVLALGLNPYIWNFKDVVFSEFVFMLFAYVSLYSFNKVDWLSLHGEKLRLILPWILISGFGLGVAYEVRTIGAVLFAAVAVISVLSLSRLRFFGPAILLLGFSVSTIISILFYADIGTYFSYFGSPFSFTFSGAEKVILHTAGDYLRGVAILFGGSHLFWTPVQVIILCVLLGLSALGVVQATRRHLSVFEVFLVGYIVALMLYPVTLEPARYALPLMPLLLYYFLFAVQNMHSPNRTYVKVGLVCAALAFLYIPQYVLGGGKYNSAGLKERVFLVDDMKAIELFQKIKEVVPLDDLILCSKPTIIALYSERRATNPPHDPTQEQFWQFVQESKTSWFVELKPPLEDELAGLIPNLQNGLERTFENENFILYRVRRH